MAEHRVADAGEIAPETAHKVTVEGIAVLICNTGGAFYAIEDVCTHDGGELDQGVLDGCEIECPRHGARFDVRTGAALTLPAFEPVRSFALRVDGRDIYLTI
jgi:3-phenylpropionate/trans-cinnamate dioxygenase ferredoxin subunit